jgi:hypothetical protein
MGTFIRHRRWVPWIFSDVTGVFAELDKVARRTQILEGYQTLRPAPEAAKRLAGLLPSIKPSPKDLEDWIHKHQPGTIVCANILGQIKPMAYKIVESAFKPRSPWTTDQDLADPLQDALDVWVAKTLKSILDVLCQSNSRLCMLHDRGVIHQKADLALGDWEDPWMNQLKSKQSYLEVSDSLPGIDMLNELDSLICLSKTRWIWPLTQKQIHVIEALAYRP